MLNAKNGHLFKPLQNPPRGKREQDFYEYIWNQNISADNFYVIVSSTDKNDKELLTDVEQLRSFIPKYFGVVNLHIDGLCKNCRFCEDKFW